jgi:bacterioferritin-associated ferredoxin
MIVCICNRLTDRQIRAKLDSSGCSVARLCQSLRVTPKCGKCLPTIQQMMEPAGSVAEQKTTQASFEATP